MTAKQKMSRRNFIRSSVVMGGAWMVAGSIPVESIAGEVRPEIAKSESSAGVSKVYMLKDITPQNMIRLYDALGRKAKGKVAVKLSTGEPGGHNFLQPTLIKDLVKKVNGTIVECNTAYGGGRADTDSHLKAAADHGFTAIAKVDAMGGFGGALKNISIGIASSAGKAWIHTAGKTKTDLWNNLPEQDHFLESMAEAAKAVTTHCGENILYISVMNRLSVDCDCDSNPEEPKMADIGMLASLDPVALDKACVDLVYASPDPGRVHLIERMESRHGIHIVEHAEALGMGSQRYDLVSLDDK